MADAEPTIKYTVNAGKPVVEVGGAWTVFSLRGIRQKAEKALQSAGSGKAARLVDASGVERLDTAGALEILDLAGAGPDAEIKTSDKAHADIFEVVQKNRCEAPPELHVNWFAHWLEEVGRNTVNLYHQGINLCEFFGEILFVFVEACLEPRRFRAQRRGAPDVRGVDPGAGDRRRAVLPDRRGDRLPGRPAAQAVRRRDLHGGSGRYRHVPRAGRSAHRHHRGGPLGQRLHRPDRHHAGQPGSRCHAHDGAQPRRMAGPAAHHGPDRSPCRCSPSGAT